MISFFIHSTSNAVGFTRRQWWPWWVSWPDIVFLKEVRSSGRSFKKEMRRRAKPALELRRAAWAPAQLTKLSPYSVLWYRISRLGELGWSSCGRNGSEAVLKHCSEMKSSMSEAIINSWCERNGSEALFGGYAIFLFLWSLVSHWHSTKIPIAQTFRNCSSDSILHLYRIQFVFPCSTWLATIKEKSSFIKGPFTWIQHQNFDSFFLYFSSWVKKKEELIHCSPHHIKRLFFLLRIRNQASCQGSAKATW